MMRLNFFLQKLSPWIELSIDRLKAQSIKVLHSDGSYLRFGKCSVEKSLILSCLNSIIG
jgi:hypothetical protein